MASPSEPAPVPERQVVNWSAVTSLITALTAVGALIFTALSLNATRDQVAVTEQGQYTDRYSRAIEQLGEQGPDRLQIRLGGIYALERLARDSPRDQPTIIEVLSTFVRTRAGAVRPDTGAENWTTGCPFSTESDVQAALTVLGRRDNTRDNGVRVNLASTCLRGVNLHRANLSKADLHEADLSGADFSEAILDHADFSSGFLSAADLSKAHLSYASLYGVDLYNADLSAADLSAGDVYGANLTYADLSFADLDAANLNEANLSNADLFQATLIETGLLSANLSDAKLNQADFTRAILAGANLLGAEHYGTITDDVITSDRTQGQWW